MRELLILAACLPLAVAVWLAALIVGQWLKASRKRTQREIAAEAFDRKPPPKVFRTVRGRRISPL